MQAKRSLRNNTNENHRLKGGTIKMSYTRLLHHIVFRTKHSANTISEEHERDLYAYLFGIAKNKNVYVYRIGGMPNHIHMLADIPPMLALADFMRELKEKSSKWLKANVNFPTFEGWGESYVAFSYNIKERETISNYIKNQKEHHKKMTFEEEYRLFLADNEIDIDEKYFLKD